MFSTLKKYGILPMALVTFVLLMLFFSLRSNLKENFEYDNNSPSNGSIVNINTSSPEEISRILIENKYVKNEVDAQFAAQVIYKRIKSKGPIGSLFDLRKSSYRATIQEVEGSKSDTYKELYRQMCQELEQTDSLFHKANNNESTLSINPSLKGSIEVRVWKKDSTAYWLSKILRQDKVPSSGIFVRLNEHTYENSAETIKSIAYLRTNAEGVCVFKGLDKTKSYSVLPVAVGYRYGNAKGTVHSTLKKSKVKYEFEQSPVTIPILTQQKIRQIKEDNKIVVRTLSEFERGLSMRFLGIIIFWWIFLLFTKFLKRPVDVLLTSSLLGLTGLACLVMHSLNNPLTDTLLGADTASGILIGCVIIALLQFLNPISFYQDKGIIHFDPLIQATSCLSNIFSKKGFGKPDKQKKSIIIRGLNSKNLFVKVISIIPALFVALISVISRALKMLFSSKGNGYLVLGILITLLLLTPLGMEVGGMKVNLNLGIKFQPSEIAKYLFVIFMAAYFCQNGDKILELDREGKAKLFGVKLKNLFVLILGFTILMLLYVYLQDLGPAMVIIFTFIILYSIIKSKDSIDKKISLKDILCCDFAILCLGVISFLAFVYFGKLVKAPGIMCIAWFVVWIGVGLFKYKQIHETSILFNLVIAAFLFGGMLQSIPQESISRIGERLEDRTSMSSNTWGQLGLNNPSQDPIPTANSQVADGLWGLATGGWNGQGLSNGECSLIPAFNTDMILESIGTQIGFIGLLFVLILYYLLFRRSLVVGYRSKHPFTFYLCVGIAIVTGVQLAIIALGSTGVIPLTGITVPLLSYGKVSMILNLFAFGLVLTVSSHNKDVSSSSNLVKKYNNSMSLLTCSFISALLIVALTFFYYQWIDRNDTLIRPVLAKDSAGVVALKYNPRIAAIVDKMRIGNIYDRNGVLLATSNKSELEKYQKKYEECNIFLDMEGIQKRYYPFGEHLFFMVGDFNSKLFFNSKRRGVLAEYEYLDSLRGYDNILRNKEGIKQYVQIKQTEVFASRFLENKIPSKPNGKTALRDYSALLPYLKAGVKSGRVKDFNEDNEGFFAMGKIKPADINISVDAILQTNLQNSISNFVSQELSGQKLTRVSAVVIDTSTGELLSSANYPLPNYENLLELSEEGNIVYNDNGLSEAYTDMDLGLFYPTPPGSTAKVMSALASFMKFGAQGSAFTYPVSYRERPTSASSDVENKVKDTNHVTMDEAITWSSNIYFIKLVNENNLYKELEELYSHVGINCDNVAPYYLVYNNPTSEWRRLFKDYTYGAIDHYQEVKKGIKNRKKEDRYRLTGYPSLNMAWGQQPINATPLAMAKVASIVANNGVLPELRFVKGKSTAQFDIRGKGIEQLQSYMKHEAQLHTRALIKEYNTGGKTGTVVRPRGKSKINDAWYICFCDKSNGHGQLAIAVRIERAGASSVMAKKMVKDIVLRELNDMGYVKSKL